MVIVMPFKLGGYKICNFSPGTFRFWPLNASRLRLNFTINQPNPGLIPTLHLKTFEILVPPPNPFRFQKFLILYCNGIGLVIYRIALVMVNRISSQVDTMRTNVTKFFPNVTKSVRKISWHYALLVWWNSQHWEDNFIWPSNFKILRAFELHWRKLAKGNVDALFDAKSHVNEIFDNQMTCFSKNARFLKSFSALNPSWTCCITCIS